MVQQAKVQGEEESEQGALHSLLGEEAGSNIASLRVDSDGWAQVIRGVLKVPQREKVLRYCLRSGMAFAFRSFSTEAIKLAHLYALPALSISRLT